jgi:hypothetical protein
MMLLIDVELEDCNFDLTLSSLWLRLRRRGKFSYLIIILVMRSDLKIVTLLEKKDNYTDKT